MRSIVHALVLVMCLFVLYLVIAYLVTGERTCLAGTCL